MTDQRNAEDSPGRVDGASARRNQRPRYGMLSNTAFMMAQAWRVRKSALAICLGTALSAATISILNLFVAPTVLTTIEEHASLTSLFAVIGLFVAGLMLANAVSAYCDTNKLFSYVEVRTYLLRLINEKDARTSYPNTLDAAFNEAESKATDSCSNNQAPTEAIWTTYSTLLADVIAFAAYLMVLSGLNGWLIALVVATTIVSYVVGLRLNGWGYRHRDEEERYVNRLYYLYRTATSRDYAKDIRVFGLRRWLDDLWNGTMRLYRGFLARREGMYLWANVVDVALTLMRNGVAYAYLLWTALSQGMSASRFLLYFTAVTGFTTWVAGILEQCSTLHRQSLDLSTLREFLAWPEPFAFDGGEPLPCDTAKTYEIRFEHVSFRYRPDGPEVLHDINLAIHPGEKVAIVGLNGAGKTTLVKLASGFLDPTEGRVLLNGFDIRRYDRRDYYALFSAVFQEYSVLDVTVAQNVAQRIDGVDIERVRWCLDKAGLTQDVAALPKGLDTPLGRAVYEDGVELSGGQTQRLMLARALYKGAPILLLDEPTAALDPIAEDDIYRKYAAMTDGRTSLFISHRLASTRFCDRILLMKDGRIVEEGTHESLLASGGGYAKLFDVQRKYYRSGGDSGQTDMDHGTAAMEKEGAGDDVSRG